MTEPAPIDAIMRALADPTWRALVERIARSDEITAGELTWGSGVTQGAVSQHLKSPRQAGLVAERRLGRYVHRRARPEGLAPLADRISHQGVSRRERLGNLRALPQQIDP